MPRSSPPGPAFSGDAGRYQILQTLGEGGMGVVYRARERDSNRVVALRPMKRLDPEARVRFKKECRTLQEVSHPNLVTLYDVVADGRERFFTMQLVEGTRSRAEGDIRSDKSKV